MVGSASAWRAWSLILRCLITGALLTVILSRIHWQDRLSLSDGTQVVGRVVSQSGDLASFRLRGGEVRVILARGTSAGGGSRSPVVLGLLSYVRRLSVWQVAAALSAFGAAHALAAFRWKLLLRCQGVYVTLGRTVALTLVGLAFGNVLLGTTGGDLAKAYYIARGTDGKVRRVSTLVMDRVLGLLGLMLVGLLGGALAWGPRQCLRVVAVPTLLVLPVVCALTALCLLLWLALRRGGRRTPNGSLEKDGVQAVVKSYIDRFAAAAREAASGYGGSRYLLTLALCVSATVHLVVISGNVLLGLALGLPVPVGSYFFLIPAVLLLSALPVSVGGWGVGDAAFVALFGLAGATSEGALALSFLSRLGGMVFWGLPGLALIVRGVNGPKGQPSPAA